jgi:demethylmenaquinone methyltransferase / 2-methoxy-6-polyprenyl-1,4-benzoquinol methylase
MTAQAPTRAELPILSQECVFDRDRHDDVASGPLPNPPMVSVEPGSAVVSGSGRMFDGIAPRYDLLNRLLSLGMDQSWRRRTVGALDLDGRARVLDLATGTADLALLIADRHPQARVVGVDPSSRMLELGRRKVATRGLEGRVDLQVATAESLPYPDRSFDAVTIAFGIRNVPDRIGALREMRRVTRTGGRLAILELTEPRHGVLGALARIHVHGIVPRLGALISGAPEYRYLEASIAAFPAPAAFTETIADAGWRVRTTRALCFGACHLFVAEARESR